MILCKRLILLYKNTGVSSVYHKPDEETIMIILVIIIIQIFNSKFPESPECHFPPMSSFKKTGIEKTGQRN